MGVGNHLHPILPPSKSKGLVDPLRLLLGYRLTPYSPDICSARLVKAFATWLMASASIAWGQRSVSRWNSELWPTSAATRPPPLATTWDGTRLQRYFPEERVWPV